MLPPTTTIQTLLSLKMFHTLLNPDSVSHGGNIERVNQIMLNTFCIDNLLHTCPVYIAVVTFLT